MNAAFERITGIPRDPWISRSVAEMQQLPGVPRQSAKLADLERRRSTWLETRLENVNLGHVVVASPQMSDLLSTAAAIAEVDCGSIPENLVESELLGPSEPPK